MQKSTEIILCVVIIIDTSSVTAFSWSGSQWLWSLSQELLDVNENTDLNRTPLIQFVYMHTNTPPLTTLWQYSGHAQDSIKWIKCQYCSDIVMGMLWTCIQRIRVTELEFYSSLRHTASCLFLVSSVCCTQTNIDAKMHVDSNISGMLLVGTLTFCEYGQNLVASFNFLYIQLRFSHTSVLRICTMPWQIHKDCMKWWCKGKQNSEENRIWGFADMFLAGRRKPENPEETYMGTGRTCTVTSHRRSSGSNRGPWMWTSEGTSDYLANIKKFLVAVNKQKKDSSSAVCGQKVFYNFV